MTYSDIWHVVTYDILVKYEQLNKYYGLYGMFGHEDKTKWFAYQKLHIFICIFLLLKYWEIVIYEGGP